MDHRREMRNVRYLDFNLGSFYRVKGDDDDDEKHPKQCASPILSAACLVYPMPSFVHWTGFVVL